MKQATRIFILLIICMSCPFAWAKQPAMQFQINGITGDLLKNVQDQLAGAWPEKKELTETDVQKRYTETATQILKSLQPYGYFQPRVQTQLNKHGDQWIVICTVNPGEPLRINKLKVSITGEGKNDPKLQQLLATFPLQEGQVLTTAAYNQAKQALFNTAEKQGYITAYLAEHEIKINLEKYKSTVKLQLATGPRFYFGKIKFSPNPWNEDFLRRYLTFKEGDPYSAQEVLTSQDQLINSNYFQQVSVHSSRDQAEGDAIPTQINVTPRKPRQYTFGLGFGTDTGVRATLGTDWRRVTASGQRFSTVAKLSQVQNSLQAIYSIPGRNPVTDQYTISASALTTSINQGDSFTQSFGVADVSSQGFWKRTIFTNYQFERFRFSDKSPQFTNESTQQSNLLIPGVQWSYLRANDPLYPTNGQQFSVKVQGASKDLISNSSFIQTEVQDKYIFSPYDGSRVLVRGDIGYTAIHDMTKFPLTMWFYAGGTQSIRGYSYQEIGPGRYLGVGSAEFQQRIYGDWSGAVFYDLGNASNEATARLLRSAGFGVVWRSPVGPLELTIAKALSKDGMPNRIQFNMGADLG